MNWEEPLARMPRPAGWPDPAPGELVALVERRLAGEPLQYVLGDWAFRTLDLIVDPRVLIPRPETEQVVEVALTVLRGRRADRWWSTWAPGPGPSPCRSPSSVRTAQVWATDVDPGALALARTNRERVRCAGRVVPAGAGGSRRCPTELRGRVDLVVSNPPYVSEAEWADLDPEVRCEPHGALVAGRAATAPRGWRRSRRCCAGRSSGWPGPALVVVELAPHQAPPVAVDELAPGHAGLAARSGGRDRRRA